MAKMYGKGKTAIESEDQARLRWQVELEFVQCLANPNYLNFLAQRGYFKDQAFINYLKYLQYWKEPDYAKYLTYPMCLYFLDLLQYDHFRREIVNAQCAKFIDDQVILMWQHYTRKRVKLLNSVNGELAINGQIMPAENTSVPQGVTSTHIANTTEFSHGQQNPQSQQTAVQCMQNGISATPLAPTTPQQHMVNGICGYPNSNAVFFHKT